jgi:hypothetical protein
VRTNVKVVSTCAYAPADRKRNNNMYTDLFINYG